MCNNYNQVKILNFNILNLSIMEVQTINKIYLAAAYFSGVVFASVCILGIVRVLADLVIFILNL